MIVFLLFLSSSWHKRENITQKYSVHHKTMTDNDVLPFISPTTLAIVGPTQSGKSVFTKRLIENSGVMFTIPPKKILYSEYQKLFDEMNDIPNLTFHEGLPDRQLLKEFSKDNDHTLLVLDDLASKIVTSEEIVHLFTVMSHHRFITVLYICQHLYQPGKYGRTISLNCANFVLFRTHEIQDK